MLCQPIWRLPSATMVSPRRRNPTLRGAALGHTQNHRSPQTNVLEIGNQRWRSLSMRIGRRVAYSSEHRSKNDGLYVTGRIARELPTLHYDEKPKRRPGRYGCSPFITGSDLGESRVPQNLGMGQNEYHDRNILGSGRSVRNRRNDHM